MSSENERREVAKRLRFCAKTTNGTIELAIGLSHWVGIDGVTDDQGNPFSTQADCRVAALTLEKLADLIDPTCHVVGTISQDWSGGSTVYVHKLSCGHTRETSMPEPPEYCDECGARVVDDGR